MQYLYNVAVKYYRIHLASVYRIHLASVQTSGTSKTSISMDKQKEIQTMVSEITNFRNIHEKREWERSRVKTVFYNDMKSRSKGNNR